jgi:heat shock protein HslJ
MKFAAILLSLALVLALAAGCVPITPEGSTVPAPAAPAESAASVASTTGQLTAEQLLNATYTGVYAEPVTLTGGIYQGPPLVEGGAARPTVVMAPGGTAHGDLNGDGVWDAAVLLAENSGGSGVFTYVAAQLNQDGQPAPAGAVMLGDRVQVRGMVIGSQQVYVDYVTQGPDEPLCCGTLLVTSLLELQDGALALVETIEQGNVSLENLMGTNWMLASINGAPPVATDQPITASFADNAISGSDGCNSYSAPVSSTGGQSLSVGPIAGTRMACNQAVMDQAAAYTMALQNAFQWGYVATQLALSYQSADGSIGALFFDPAPPPAAATGSIYDVVWEWTSVIGQATGSTTTVPSPQDYTIVFRPDGTLNGQADCNSFTGAYSQENGFAITLGAMTMAACGEDSLDQEYLQLLSAVAAGGPGGAGGLALETAGGEQRMLFQNGGAPTL